MELNPIEQAIAAIPMWIRLAAALSLAVPLCASLAWEQYETWRGR